MPAEHGRSLNMNSPLSAGDSGMGQSFSPPDFTADAIVITPVDPEPPLESEWTYTSRRERIGRWVKKVLIWVVVALSILTVHFGIEQLREFKAILTERICELDQISLFYITVGCVFVIPVFVNMFCWDRNCASHQIVSHHQYL